MKMYPELCKEILRQTEESEGLPTLRHFDIEGYTEDSIGYHCLLLGEAGLLKITDARDRDDHWAYFPKRLTLKGHEFLTTAKNDTVWKKAIEHFRKNGIPVTLTALQIALSQGLL